jgi:hypothetical protein
VATCGPTARHFSPFSLSHFTHFTLHSTLNPLHRQDPREPSISGSSADDGNDGSTEKKCKCAWAWAGARARATSSHSLAYLSLSLCLRLFNNRRAAERMPRFANRLESARLAPFPTPPLRNDITSSWSATLHQLVRCNLQELRATAT